MKEFYRAKFNELFMEFNRYLITHPEFGKDIPKGSEIILLDRNDPGYTRYMLKKAPKKDVVFIDVANSPPSVPDCENQRSFQDHPLRSRDNVTDTRPIMLSGDCLFIRFQYRRKKSSQPSGQGSDEGQGDFAQIISKVNRSLISLNRARVYLDRNIR